MDTATEDMLTELQRIAGERASLDARRDELVRALMLAETKVSRERIAKAADVSVPRLYQIRDGRR